jgi:PAS domain S-box-containing protein
MQSDNASDLGTARAGQLVEHPQWFAVALASIGDGVIATDAAGNVRFLNPVAESLTGWPRHQALGQPLDQVFRIVNEESRASVENPALRAMREGIVLGLANHTLLLARDGRELAIDDSGAPIRSEAGELIGSVLVFRDVTEQRRTDMAKALLAEVIDSSLDAIITKDLQGVVTSWNAAAERMFGYSASEAIGQPVSALIIPPDRRREEEMFLTRLRRGERIDHFETERVAKDGRIIQISVTVSPVRNRHGEVVGASKIGRDVTQRREAETERTRLLEAERAARERAEAASRAKDEFVAMISHEIRSPLNAILGWAQTLRQASLDVTATSRALESIERNARAQAQLLDDLLDISRAIAGKLRIDPRPIDIQRSLDAALESIRPAAKAKSITIDVHRDPRKTIVTADSDRLQQVFWNLLSNAVKFTPKHGHIAVTVQRLSSHLEVKIRDSGIGIPETFLPHLFERFEQADTTTVRRHSGLGLGLAIARHLIELHGGSISATSAGQGQGATFSVALPVRVIQEDVDELATTTSIETLAMRAVLDGLRVIIVDDELETRELLATVLEARGAEVRACASAADALDVIQEWNPEVLVSDIGMPEEDGYSLIAKVRRLPSDHRNVPAVALTAYARADDRMRALTVGFQMHVPKPVEVAELVLVVANLGGRGVPSA